MEVLWLNTAFPKFQLFETRFLAYLCAIVLLLAYFLKLILFLIQVKLF